MQSTVETALNEAIHLCWKQSLINSVYLPFQHQFCQFLDLGWFARFRIQFLLDHYNDPFLSSVCVYHLYRCNTSILCRGATAHLPMLPNEATEDVVDGFMDA